MKPTLLLFALGITGAMAAQVQVQSPASASTGGTSKSHALTVKQSSGQPPTAPFTPQEVSLLFSGTRSDERILLTLNNNHTVALPVNLTVFTASGQPVSLPQLELVSNESRIVELSPILNKAGLGQQELGFLRIDYNGIFLGLGAQLTLYPSGGVGVDSPRSLSTDFSSPHREAAFWLSAGANVTLALTNMSTDALAVQLRCGLLDRTLSISGHATNIQKLSISDMMPTIAQTNLPFSLPSGCELSSNGSVSSLRAVGVVTRSDRYNAPVRFYDAATATSTNITAPNLRTSAQTHVTVLNTSDAPIIAAPILMEATLGEPKRAILPTYTIAPHDTVELAADASLDELRQQGVESATLTVNTTAAKGSMVGAVTQIAANGLIEDIPLRTANRAGYAAGAYPLRWDQDYTNRVSVTNTADTPLIARALITTGTMTYSLPQELIAPGRTMLYDVDRLRANKIPDLNGNILPQDTVYGKFMWFEIGMGHNFGLMGRNSVTSELNHRRSSFSCGMGCAYSYDEYPVFEDQSPFAYMPYGGTFGSRIIEYTQGPYGQVYTAPYYFSNTALTSSYSSILSYAADPSSSTSYMAYGNSGGSVTASYLDTIDQPYEDQFGDCDSSPQQFTNQGGAGVQVPTSTQYSNTLSNVPSSCTVAGQAGWDLSQTRYVADQNGNIIPAVQSLAETVTLDPGHNGLNLPSPGTRSASTNAAGYYGEHVFMCTPSCPGSANTTATQSIQDTLNGGSFTLAPNHFVYSCSGNSVNGQS